MAPALAIQAAAVEGGHCHHCGEAITGHACTVELDGQPRSFCCQGCAAASEWIAQADLDGYYRLRSAAGGRVVVVTVTLVGRPSRMMSIGIRDPTAVLAIRKVTVSSERRR